ncbi:MAG: glycosyltransferase family 2 protein [Alphaproteobacteria bacterium]|nr:glycosyltransferase family 2 protein [Alphaproteobacteria bacterium]
MMAQPAPLATRLRIHLYTICWNEAAMLGFFFRHYDPLISRYVFYDDGSTDGTLEMLARHPRVEVRRFHREQPDSYVHSALLLQDRMWKESRGAADWVVITAVDEHLHHPNLPYYIEACYDSGVTLVPALGYQMVDRSFPPPDATLAKTVRRGAPYQLMSKLSLFRPDALTETIYEPGRHTAQPTGRVVFPKQDELLLLHYKYLAPDYVAARNALLATGLGDMDRANRWGVQYHDDAAAVDAAYRDFEAQAVDIADPAHLPWRDHAARRWWRVAPPRSKWRGVLDGPRSVWRKLTGRATP